jgi:diadenosine tetraphosphate (Ap4A) HIT family hydrolase
MHMSQSDSPVDPRYAKSDSYRKVLEKIIADGKCPFCIENLWKHHKKPTLYIDGEWLLTPSQWPYEGAELHFLCIPRRHVERITDLSVDDFASVKALIVWAIENYHISGGALLMREGATSATGATVRHLHFHYIVPKEGAVVNFPIG